MTTPGDPHTGARTPAVQAATSGRWGAVILAGGRGQRLGGTDKALVEVHGVPLLTRTVGSVVAAHQIVVVGPPRRLDLPAPVRWIREASPGGGPLPAVLAGAAILDREVDVVVTLACDHPWLGGAPARLAGALAHAPTLVDAVVGVDPQGRIQPLLAAYRRAVLAGPAPAPGGSLRDLLAALTVRTSAVEAREAFDVDTAQDAARARENP